MTLAELSPNKICRIVSAAAENAEMQSRLYTLGLYPGSQVEVLRYAPVGDPIQVRTGSTLLSIRKYEAALIEVEAATS